MNEKPIAKYGFDDMDEFLAHAHALESEVAERYREIADAMEVHNNPEVAALFRELAEQSAKHGREVLEYAHKPLPHVAPWAFRWGDNEAPETPTMSDVHYLMKPFHALSMARRAESQAQDFYARVATDSHAEAIRDLAKEFATEESQHVATLDRWLKKYPKPASDWDFDPDPPGIPGG
jgi:rubrerythrin